MTNSPLRIGIIGAGRIGRLHAEHLAYRIPEAEAAAVADADEAAASACAAACRIARAETDYRAVLDAADVDAVAICTPTDTHARLIEEAAAHGKHIFCEKPIAQDLAVIDQALAAVDRAGVALQVGFNRRFDANFARLRQAVVAGEIGAPRLLHIISRDPAPPPIDYVKRSGGLFLDMTIHDFDMARFLIGAEIAEVYAAAGVHVDPAIGDAGDLDTAHITLTFDNGVIGTIDNCREAVYGYDQRAEILGSAGAAATSNNFPNTAVVSTAACIQRDLPLNFFMERYTDSFIAELRAFVHAVQHGAPVPVSGRDGRAPVAMALAARKSYDAHRPVALAEVEPG